MKEDGQQKQTKQIMVQVREGMEIKSPILQQLQMKGSSFNDWKQRGFGEQMPKVEEWGTPNIQLGTNFEEKILFQLSNIKFTHLKNIFFPSNNISSVEILSRISMPCLRWISLGLNNIVWTKNMRKANWPDLYQLYLNDNHIIDVEKLAQLNMPKIIHLSIKLQENKNVCDDLSWTLKLPVEKIKSICFKGINEKNLTPVIKKKKQDIKMGYYSGNF